MVSSSREGERGGARASEDRSGERNDSEESEARAEAENNESLIGYDLDTSQTYQKKKERLAELRQELNA